MIRILELSNQAPFAEAFAAIAAVRTAGQDLVTRSLRRPSCSG